MKKIILVLLVAVILATSCFAQEVESDGLFSIEGTLWEFTIVISPPNLPRMGEIGFYKGKVYIGDIPLEGVPFSFYVDLGIASFFMGIDMDVSTMFFGIMQPIGMGMITTTSFIPLPIVTIATLDKINDNWSPSEEPEG